jgi:predicted transcriptional regulator
MPKRTYTHQHSAGRLVTPGRALGGFLVGLGLIATTSCTPIPKPEPVSNPVKLLQSVRVGLSPAAGVETVEGTTISVSAAGESSAEETKYDAAQVVGELPVRVSLQYRAGEKSGADLAELEGHTGPVEIRLTLENLTVGPRVIEYDAAGQTRADTALVGAPLTIAASTKLAGVRADDVTPGAADGASGTNGVLSNSEDGATVVQWATVLAPPRSGASTTLRLVADVEDFQVPDFDVAVQPGLNTDLSANGVIASAFSTGAGSEMELQRRTISLVSDVNTVLTKAGSTITEVRQNLQETSQTLGVKTAGELRDNSQALAATMSGLKEQLRTLGADLESATTTTQSTTASQLKQTVFAVDSMLGDTSALPPTVPINGEGCAAEVPKSATSATVYSSVLTMASQLDAYAKVSAGCRDAVAGAIAATMGPENPTAEECAEQGSMTCSLYGSAVTITGALLGLVKKGDEIVAGLQPHVVNGAIRDQEAAAGTLDTVRNDVAAILDGAETTADYTTALAEVDKAIKSARASVGATREAAAEVRNKIDGLRQKLTEIRAAAEGAKKDLGNAQLLNGSMLQQNQRLADELCKLADGSLPREGRLSAKEVEELRSYLTSVPCVTTDESGNQVQALTPPFGFKDPLDARLQAQSAAWDAVLAATDSTAPEQAISQALATLGTAIDDIDTKLDAINEATNALDRAATGKAKSTKGEIEALNKALREAIESSGRVGMTLAQLKEQQDDLGEKIKQSLGDVSTETADEVLKSVDQQVRQVAEIGEAGSGAVITAFNRSISGLKSTSDEVVSDASGTVDKQRDELLGQSDELAASLAQSTQSSLANIASSTSGSTRDVEGANALLSSSLGKVMLDLGDRSVNGSGLLGSMATSAAKAGTADYQLALASQNAEGYANIRSRDVAGLLLRQAQFKTSLAAAAELPPFHLEVPAGATSQTLYTLKIGGGA